MHAAHCSEAEVHISYSRLIAPLSVHLEGQYLGEMPRAIRRAILRYRRWQDRQATLLGKMLLLRSLQQHDSRTGRDKFQSLQHTPTGKPFIPGGPEFNISHSGEMIVLAMSRQGALGIDIEQIHAVNLEDFKTYVPEMAHFEHGIGSPGSFSLFFHLWTQKEAVAKACGLGLLAPLETIWVVDGKVNCNATAWYVKKIPIQTHGYCCHLAIDRQYCRITLEEVHCTALNEGVASIGNGYSSILH